MRCDIFCRVIDNFGDIGVCWRLARQLRIEHDVAVTLWVDDLTAFARLTPALDTTASTQNLDGIALRQWSPNFPSDAKPGELVIEAFACELPSAFVTAMAAQAQKPVWLNLEYLSAEDWATGCHGLASPQASGLNKYFWFPGFNEASGGLLRERYLLRDVETFQHDLSVQAQFWASLQLPEALGFDRRCSLFAYENAATPALLNALSDARERTLLIVPEGRALNQLRHISSNALLPGGLYQQRNLTIAPIALLSHQDYDRLLWACDVNFVRGEDSFVRAQWAAKPLIWHIYPQEEDAHWPKLAAFLNIAQSAGLPPIWADVMRGWNRGEVTATTWSQFFDALPAITPSAQRWAQDLSQHTDLAAGVMHFCRSRVE